MTILSIDQKIETSKIFVGLIIAIVGGFWTYVTYTSEARTTELNTIIMLGNSIAGMNVACKKIDGKLSLLDADGGKRSSRCNRYFESGFQRAMAGSIAIKKPFFTSDDEWKKLWSELQDSIQLASNSKINYKKIDNAWTAILKEKL